MKNIIAILLAVLICAGCAAPAVKNTEQSVSVEQPAAAEQAVSAPSSDEIAPLPQPVLVTSFGQSPDSMVAKEIFHSLGIDFTYDATAAPDTIGDYKCIVIAVGTSVKSLIAIGIDPEDELKRCEQFAAAIPDDIPVIMLRVGSSQGSAEFSGSMISSALSSADIAIVTNSGDEKRNIEKLAEENEVSYYRCSQVRDIDALLGELFGKK